MTIRGRRPLWAGGARWQRLVPRAVGGEQLCRRSSFLRKQPVTLQAPRAVRRSVSPLWPLDILVCTEEAAGVSMQRNTRSAEDAEIGNKDKGIMTEAATLTASSKAGDAANQKPGQRVCEGGASPRDSRAVLASGEPGKAPDRIHRLPREVLSTSTQLGAPAFASGCLVVARLSPASSHTCFCFSDLSPCGDPETGGSDGRVPSAGSAGGDGEVCVPGATAPSAQRTPASSDPVPCECNVS